MTLPLKSMVNPNRHLMALVTFLSLLPLVYFIPELIILHVTDNKLLSTLLAVAIIVPIISYGVMPCFIKAYRFLQNLKPRVANR